MSGARGIDRRLRVVEHGCCGRGANLVSVQFVKRSAGKTKRERSAKILLCGQIVHGSKFEAKPDLLLLMHISKDRETAHS